MKKYHPQEPFDEEEHMRVLFWIGAMIAIILMVGITVFYFSD